MNNKIVALIVVALIGASAFCVALSISIHDHMVNDNHSENHILNRYDTLFYDVGDADALMICTVSDSGDETALGKSATVSCDISAGGSAVRMPVGDPSSESNNTYDGYHNELLKLYGDKVETVCAYTSQSDMKDGRDPLNIDSNIVYLEKCGSLYLMMYYNHNLKDVYRMISLENYDFWSNDKDFTFIMVDANTGKIFKLSGLWCGSTGWRYDGTNDIIPSIQYMGTYGGEEYFKVNVECNKYATTPVNGMFSNLEGIVAFHSDGNTLHTRNVMVDDDAMTKRNIADRNDESAWEQIEGKTKRYGYAMTLYNNGVIRYTLNDPSTFNGWQGSLKGDEYLWFTNGETVKLEDGWMEMSGYICRDVQYENVHFPKSAEIYEPDGTMRTVAYTDSESYDLAASNHYNGCIYRERMADCTRIYMLKQDGTVDRLTLNSTLDYSVDENIFGEALPLVEPRSYHDPADDSVFYDFNVRNNIVFYGPMNWSYSQIFWNTGISIIGSNLFILDGSVMKEYSLLSREIKNYDVPDTAIMKINVDGNGQLYMAYMDSGNIRRTNLEDGGFQVSRTAIQLQVVKKILCNE